jgi:hypothetical protein
MVLQKKLETTIPGNLIQIFVHKTLWELPEVKKRNSTSQTKISRDSIKRWFGH